MKAEYTPITKPGFSLQMSYRNFVIEYLAVVRVVVAETPRFPQLAKIFRAAGPSRGFRIVAALLTNTHTCGIVNVAYAEVAARLFLDSILSYVLTDVLIIASELHLPPAERVDTMVDMFMMAIRPAATS